MSPLLLASIGLLKRVWVCLCFDKRVIFFLGLLLGRKLMGG